MIPWAYSPSSPISSSPLCTRGIAYPTLYYIVLFYRLPCDICSACLLPTVHPGNTPYIRTDPTPFQGVAGCQPAQAFSRSSTFAYTATEQVHQQMPGRSHPHTRLVGIRIRSSTFLGRSRMLQSSYTSRCLADRIRIYWLDRYGSGEEWEAVATRPGAWGYLDHTQSPPEAIGNLYAISYIAVQLCPAAT